MSCCVKMNVRPGTRQPDGCVLSNTFLNAKLHEVHFDMLSGESFTSGKWFPFPANVVVSLGPGRAGHSLVTHSLFIVTKSTEPNMNRSRLSGAVIKKMSMHPRLYRVPNCNVVLCGVF